MGTRSRGITASAVKDVLPFPGLIQHFVGAAAAVVADRPEGATVLAISVTGAGSTTLQMIAGSFLGTQTFTAITGPDALIIGSDDYITGDGPYQLTTTGTLPAGLALATDYWVYVPAAGVIQLCTSLANALNTSKNDMGGEVDNPIFVDITDNGAGTHTIQSGFPTLPAADSALGLFPLSVDIDKQSGNNATFAAPKRMTLLPSAASVRVQLWWS